MSIYHETPKGVTPDRQKRQTTEGVYAFWLAYPHLRLGQFLYNVAASSDRDMFYVEDDEWTQLCQNFLKKFPPTGLQGENDDD